MKQHINSRYLILTFLILGSAVRIIYGLYFQHRIHNPDELAWELILKSSHFAYEYLVFYPHEGGSVLNALVCKGVQLFTSWQPLFLTAIIIDFIVRWTQLSVCLQVFGRQTMLAFGLWTIFAIPSIIPWGTLNYGLHSSASIFPFIMLWLINYPKNESKYYLISGVFLGLAVWYSYINIVLALVYCLFLLLKSNKNFSRWGISILSFLFIISLHYIVRINFDAGFELNRFEMASIRGEYFELNNSEKWLKLIDILDNLLKSSIAYPNSTKISDSLYYSFLAFCLFFIWKTIKTSIYKITSVKYSLILILAFMFFYTLSPFYSGLSGGNYITYRHLTYILPLFFLIVIHVLQFRTSTNRGIALFLVLCCFNGLLVFSTNKAPKHPLNIKAAGWVLGKKLGHEPKKLNSIIIQEGKSDSLLYQGVAWGVASSLFERNTDSLTSEEQFNSMLELFNNFPDSTRNHLRKGVHFAFGSKAVPRLDSTFGVKVTKRLDSIWNFQPIENQ